MADFADSRGQVHQGVILVDPITGQPYAAANAATSADREVIVTTYRVKTAFTGASVGDTLTCTQVMEVSATPPTTVATVWRNQTTAQDLASAPLAANIEVTGAPSLTDTQLRASPLKVNPRQVATVEYIVRTAFTGAAINDMVQARHLLDTSASPPAVVGTSWFNLTTGSAISTAPSYANISPPDASTVVASTTTTTLTTTSANGTVAAGARFIRFTPATGMVLTVDGQTLTASSTTPTYTKTAPAGCVYGAVAWSVTGTVGQVLNIIVER